jgi:hypothetical protein
VLMREVPWRSFEQRDQNTAGIGFVCIGRKAGNEEKLSGLQKRGRVKKTLSERQGPLYPRCGIRSLDLTSLAGRHSNSDVERTKKLALIIHLSTVVLYRKGNI